MTPGPWHIESKEFPYILDEHSQIVTDNLSNNRLKAAAPELLILAELALAMRQGVAGINGKLYEAQLKDVIAKAQGT